MEVAIDPRREQLRLSVDVFGYRDRALAEPRRRFAYDLLAQRDDLVVRSEHPFESVDRRDVADGLPAQRIAERGRVGRDCIALELEHLPLAHRTSPVERAPLHLHT